MTVDVQLQGSSSERRADARRVICVDGNEAAAAVAHRLSEVITIYPITPASPMGELADAWSAAARPNLWGAVPEVIEMQSEAGAAGVLHGAVQKGALATTFTASQGLLLMLPNMFKLAGELSPTVIHVAARTIATHALSIFGDHSDVMAARMTGFAMLASSSVQEAQDLALVAHAATLESRVPFLHFFDGFRTSHEIGTIEALDDDDLRALISEEAVRAHRFRGLSPDRPVLRGSAQNPDVFFQAREASSPFHAAVADVVQRKMDEFAVRTGRQYHVVDYHGAADADRVIVLMGSGAGAVAETVDALNGGGEKVGLLAIRLFRPFPSEALVAPLPPTVRAIAVLDRTKEPGAIGEPLYQDVATALVECRAAFANPPRVIGGRYGLSSKEFTPAMAKSVFEEAAKDQPRNHFTVGIVDDVSHSSLPWDSAFSTEPDATTRAVFYGLGSDGTVGATKQTVKIIGEETGLHAQGYFVYDSKKSGSVTVSHLRFGPEPIRSSYLIDRANFVSCSQFTFLERLNVLKVADRGATFLLNSPFGPETVWERLPAEVRRHVVEKDLQLWVIDAFKVAREAGLGARINTVMQPCFFALSGVLPRDQAIAEIKRSVEKAYGKRGEEVVRRNFAAIDLALENLHRVEVSSAAVMDGAPPRPVVAPEAPDFVQRVTAKMLSGEGDLLPVSALPVDGTFPTGTAAWEKRCIAQEIPVWDPSICIDCGKCALVCPHAAIRMKVFDPAELEHAPPSFLWKDFSSREVPDLKLSIQVSPMDCTGCGICVDICPAKSKEVAKHKSLDMAPIAEHLDQEQGRFEFFERVPDIDPTLFPSDTIKGSQIRRPLFEYSGACSGCGETPYLKLLSQQVGDRLLVANATGCSSIYGGNLPTTPWASNGEGRGPAWANSLFEDNAEFGLGMRLALDRQRARARQLLAKLAPRVGQELTGALLDDEDRTDAGVIAQRERIIELEHRLASLNGSLDADARELLDLADELVRKSVWIVGGDGWAYDIGFGGLDHVLASGRDVNILVLDTEVYSNTGGQASKSTPRAAVAKFAARGKPTGKKDLGQIAMAYGNVYVAQVAMGANDMQTVKAFAEAEAWPGPSLIIAYSTCIEHGIEMSTSMSHQKDAARSGHWPLYRFNPGVEGHPFHLDTKAPSIPIRDFAMQEARFAMLARTAPGRFEELLAESQRDIDERWKLYEQLAHVERTAPDLPHADDATGREDVCEEKR